MKKQKTIRLSRIALRECEAPVSALLSPCALCERKSLARAGFVSFVFALGGRNAIPETRSETQVRIVSFVFTAVDCKLMTVS